MDKTPIYCRDKEGAKEAHVSVNTFRAIAERAGAVIRISERVRLTDMGKFYAELERIRQEQNA